MLAFERAQYGVPICVFVGNLMNRVLILMIINYNRWLGIDKRDTHTNG